MGPQPVNMEEWGVTEPTPDELVRIKGDFYMTTPERSIIDLLRVYPQSYG